MAIDLDEGQFLVFPVWQYPESWRETVPEAALALNRENREDGE